MDDSTVDLADGRVVGYADFGEPDGFPVLWCHSGPGSRLEPSWWVATGKSLGLRFIGIDRPGYGSSPPLPGRTIAGWVPDALAVMDHLQLDRFAVVGTSTGGAYALAVAALAPERVTAAVPCCSVTDMRDPECRALMSPLHSHAVWAAPDRGSAIRAAEEAHGENGSRLVELATVLCPSDLAMYTDPAWVGVGRSQFSEWFRWGQQGYADDRLADGDGWITFDVEAISCPVTVLHGGRDVLTSIEHARHTAALIPHADLAIYDDLGHFSIEAELPGCVARLIAP